MESACVARTSLKPPRFISVAKGRPGLVLFCLSHFPLTCRLRLAESVVVQCSLILICHPFKHEIKL